MGSFIYFIVNALLELIILAMIVNAIFSWLIAFDVVNLRNRFIYQLTRFLDAVTSPFLRPVQKIIPPFGGVDVSPIIVILVLIGIQRYILPLIFTPLIGLIG
jgi:YggT family protein